MPKGIRRRYAGLTDDERLLHRFVYLIDWQADTECWLFRGGRMKGDYRYFKVDGRNVSAHRWSYTYFVGPIPDGFTIDHVRARGCVATRCVNPDHLEAVTMQVNILRGDGLAGRNARKTIAKCGHPFTMLDNGRRRCAPCYKRNTQERQRRYEERNRVA